MEPARFDAMRIPVLLLAIATVVPSTALAQGSVWEVTVRGGIVRNDVLPEGDADPVFGVGAFLWSTAGLGVGATLDWIPSDDDSFALGTSGALDIDVIEVAAEAWWAVPVASRLRPAFGAGLGAATTRIEGELAGDAVDTSETDLMVPLAVGVTIPNREVAPAWAIRFEVRDDVVFGSDEDPVGDPREDDVLHNVHATVGVSFFFGGRGPEYAVDSGRP